MSQIGKKEPEPVERGGCQEIERKFIVETVPFPLEFLPCKEIEQGYLSGTLGELHVRVRRVGERFTLALKQGRGLVRTEIELPLALQQYEALWPLTAGKRLRKKRYAVLHGIATIEVDVYEDALFDLCIAEVEFASEAEASAFQKPEWFGREVTGDLRYSNYALAGAQAVPETDSR